MRIAAGAAVLGVAAVCRLGLRRSTGLVPPLNAPAEHWGLLKSYCVDCHNSAEFTAGIAFDAM